MRQQDGSPVPEWYFNAEAGTKVKPVEFFITAPDEPEKFGSKVRISPTFTGVLRRKEGTEVIVAFCEGFTCGEMLVTAHASKFKPV